jgi:predicted DNA binding CopG/RHH family protein
MSKRIKYSDEPIGELTVVKDFLPPPEELVFHDESVKVTISLSRRSIDFFKGEAQKNHTKYQQMIRQLLDVYTDTQSKRVKT